MDIYIYNTLTHKKEIFRSIETGKVKIYACGVTVYDKSHLGHARGAINFDVMRNVFRELGYTVTYIKNYTDIDDKMINRANERGITVAQLAKEMIAIHDTDMESLMIAPPELAPRATDHIGEMIEIVESLIQKGYAYESDGNVFFRVRRFPEYGKLSWKNIDDLVAGSRVAIDENKEDALDFSLWKAAKAGEPHWQSPWGSGRPGWHVECSAMARKHLGDTIDIHAGGSDLIFPHHENEIAQSECASGKVFANYWMHNGLVTIQRQKMSKSLGNFATIEDLVQKYHPELIRFFTLSAQYRQELDYSDKALEKSAEGLDRVYGALERFERTYDRKRIESAEVAEKIGEEYRRSFMAAMCDDLNTPLAIAVLFDIVKALNTSIGDIDRAAALRRTLLELGGILGILTVSPLQWFKMSRIKTEAGTLSDREVETLVLEREKARNDKNWTVADNIRARLEDASILIEDTGGKTTWRRK